MIKLKKIKSADWAAGESAIYTVADHEEIIIRQVPRLYSNGYEWAASKVKGVERYAYGRADTRRELIESVERRIEWDRQYSEASR